MTSKSLETFASIGAEIIGWVELDSSTIGVTRVVGVKRGAVGGEESSLLFRKVEAVFDSKESGSCWLRFCLSLSRLLRFCADFISNRTFDSLFFSSKSR